jgi:hypothetical protein
MKRVLALLIVCAMASAASAATVEILRNGEALVGSEVEASDLIQIRLIDDGSDGTATQVLGNSAINVSTSDSYSHTFYAPPSMGGWTFTPAGDGYTSIGAGTWFGGQLPQDGIFFTHEFHITGEFSDEVLVDYDIVYSRITDQTGSGQLLLHVVPEPTTIALLGIGALSLLRRRRKA